MKLVALTAVAVVAAAFALGHLVGEYGVGMAAIVLLWSYLLLGAGFLTLTLVRLAYRGAAYESR